MFFPKKKNQPTDLFFLVLPMQQNFYSSWPNVKISSFIPNFLRAAFLRYFASETPNWFIVYVFSGNYISIC